MTDSNSHDVFICHASEDKKKVARPLANSLEQAGLSVWYDEFSLGLGDSLRRAIDRGLKTSRFGVVIFSPSFFKKKWPQDELDGLFAKESVDRKVILPVWHHIGREFLLEQSPILADRMAALTSDGLDVVTEKILAEVQPKRAHRTRKGRTVSVDPQQIRLGVAKRLGTEADWAITTPILVVNGGSRPVYSVCLRISLSSGISPGDIKIETADGTWRVLGSLADLDVSSVVGQFDQRRYSRQPKGTLLSPSGNRVPSAIAVKARKVAVCSAGETGVQEGRAA